MPQRHDNCDVLIRELKGQAHVTINGQRVEYNSLIQAVSERAATVLATVLPDDRCVNGRTWHMMNASLLFVISIVPSDYRVKI
jgi:hypothetical protein